MSVDEKTAPRARLLLIVSSRPRSPSARSAAKLPPAIMPAVAKVPATPSKHSAPRLAKKSLRLMEKPALKMIGGSRTFRKSSESRAASAGGTSPPPWGAR